MTSTKNKFKIEDLYIGMEISDKNQLSDIYDESDKLFVQGNVVCPIYNDSLDLEGDIYYEE